MPDWSQMGSWHLVLPPNRPDRRNLDLLRACASRFTRPVCGAILGSTPEYRSALRDLCDEFYIIDRSAEFKALSDSIVGTSDKEIFVQGEWEDILPQSEGVFSVVCSHFTHGNIPFSKRARFFDTVSRSLRDDGVFFDTVFDLRGALYDLPHVEDRFLHEPINLRTANAFNAIGLFQNVIIGELGCVDTTRIYACLERLANPHLRRFVEYTKHITPPGLVWDYAPGRGPEAFQYPDFFDIQQRLPEVPSSPFAGNSYLLISGRRAR